MTCGEGEGVMIAVEEFHFTTPTQPSPIGEVADGRGG